MLGHQDINVAGEENAKNMAEYYDTFILREDKLKFLAKFINYEKNAPSGVSNQERETYSKLMNQIVAPTTSKKNESKYYDNIEAQLNVKKFYQLKFENALRVGQNYQSALSQIDASKDNREAAAGFVALASPEGIMDDTYKIMEQQILLGDKKYNKALIKNYKTSWYDKCTTWYKEAYDDFVKTLDEESRIHLKNGLDLTTDNSSILSNYNPEELGLKYLDAIKASSVKKIIDENTDISYKGDDLKASLNKFNTRRSKIFLGYSADPENGKESTEHKLLRESTQDLINANAEFNKSLYCKDIPAEEKERLADRVKHCASLVLIYQEGYEARKKDTPGSPAGKLRKEGSTEIKNIADRLSQDMDKYIKGEMKIKIDSPKNLDQYFVKPEKDAVKKDATKKNLKKEVVKKNNKIGKKTNFEIQQQSKIEINSAIVDDEIKRAKIMSDQPGFSLEKVPLNNEMRYTIQLFALQARKLNGIINGIEINDDISDIKNLYGSLKKLENIKGNENLSTVNNIIEEVSNAANKVKTDDPIKKIIADKTKSFKDIFHVNMNNSFNKRLLYINNKESQIDNYKKDYNAFLKEIEKAKAKGINSKELNDLHRSINSLTKSINNKSTYNDIVAKVNEVNNMAYNCFGEAADVQKLADKCLTLNNNALKNFSTLKPYEQEEIKNQKLIESLKNTKKPLDRSLEQIAADTKAQLKNERVKDAKNKKEISDDDFMNEIKKGNEQLEKGRQALKKHKENIRKSSIVM